MNIVGDELGPDYVVKVYNHKYKVWGFLVIDNLALGPGKGGIRMTPSVSEEEVARLARAMTLKNALAGIAFGGAKAGIQFDPKTHSLAEKREIVKWFARALTPLMPKLYIAGPDINMTEREMAIFVKAVGNRRVATGKPRSLGGLPHELGSTGFGVAEAVKIALAHLGIPHSAATVAIEGFGNVGEFAFKFLNEAGVKIVAVSDSRGVIYEKNGLDFKKLKQVKKATGSVINYPHGEKLSSEKIFALPVTVLIPAALPDVINESNVAAVKAEIIVEGANIAVTQAAEKSLIKQGVLLVPDFVANAGGVISSFAEHCGYNEAKMFALVKKKISSNLITLLQTKKPKETLREAATALARQRLSRKRYSH